MKKKEYYKNIKTKEEYEALSKREKLMFKLVNDTPLFDVENIGLDNYMTKPSSLAIIGAVVLISGGLIIKAIVD